MKLVIATALVLCLFTTNAHAATDSTKMQKAAAGVCQCLDKSNIKGAGSPDDMQTVFLKCMMDSASGVMAEIMTKATEMGDDGESMGQQLGKELAMEMLKQNCGAFLQMSMKLSGEETTSKKPTGKVEATCTLSGTLVSVSESEFLSLVIQTENGRKQTFFYFEYVPKSDEWLKNPKSLVGKKITVGFKESEFYRPSIKTFVNIKQLVSMAIDK
ncbi:MAG: hypothetical protein EAY75_10605 [Bacteroidetes bacterium]|nr:MAG: hypothetical protein EAY75_10605 [Bacteroidota bacterium]